MIALIGLAVSHAAITPESVPQEGAPTVLLVTDDQDRPAAGVTVRVVHRPGISGERELAVGVTDGRGRVRWTPEVPGVAHVRAGNQALPVRVDRTGWPVSTLLLLGLLVLGGATALGYGLGVGARS